MRYAALSTAYERLTAGFQVGYDLEQAVLTSFAGLWAIPEYENYVETNFGPAGEYLMSCRKCKLVKPFLKLVCECRGPPVEVCCQCRYLYCGWLFDSGLVRLPTRNQARMASGL